MSREEIQSLIGRFTALVNISFLSIYRNTRRALLDQADVTPMAYLMSLEPHNTIYAVAPSLHMAFRDRLPQKHRGDIQSS